MLSETHSIYCTDLFIVKLITIGCGFQFFKQFNFVDTIILLILFLKTALFFSFLVV